MKCEARGRRTAVVFRQQTRGGRSTEIRLCSQCARERGLDKDGDLAQSLAKLLASLPADRGSAKAPAPKSCPACGSSVEDLRKSGLASCQVCWELFGPELLKSTYPDAAALAHAGRLPSRLEERRSRRAELESSKENLARALASEDYETAARCRDRIRALEAEEGLRA